MNSQLKTRRIFFALWPDDLTRQKLSESLSSSVISELHGHIFKAQNLHLTLHFLGNVSAETFNCVLTAAEKIQFSPFDLTLDCYGVFKRPKVFWMGVSNIPPALYKLYEDLGDALAVCDYQVEKRDFTPHVTLMRKIKRFDSGDKKIQPVFWHIKQFALVESIQDKDGVIYKPVKFYN